jgi:hypothetical protein
MATQTLQRKSVERTPRPTPYDFPLLPLRGSSAESRHSTTRVSYFGPVVPRLAFLVFHCFRCGISMRKLHFCSSFLKSASASENRPLSFLQSCHPAHVFAVHSSSMIPEAEPTSDDGVEVRLISKDGVEFTISK